jgi:hypothetical protein
VSHEKEKAEAEAGKNAKYPQSIAELVAHLLPIIDSMIND